MSTADRSYFQTQVLTAPRQKLHLMLLEGALRHGRKAEELWQAGHEAAADEAMRRSQEVLVELIGGLRPDVAPDLVKRVLGTYVFIYRSLVLAQLQHDQAKLADGLRVLEVECETWRQLCQQLESQAAATTAPPTLPRPAFTHHTQPTATPTGLNFEA